MSGPKVVRIVTREELIAVCEGHIARVDAALSEWTRVGLRNGAVSEEEIRFSQSRRDKLRALIAAESFAELQKQAPLEVAFLRNDIQQRLANVAKREAEARSRERRNLEAGQAILNRLLAADVSLESGLIEGLRRGEGEAIAKGLALVPLNTEVGAAAGLASKLRDPELEVGQTQWSSLGFVEDPEKQRLEERLIELKMYQPADTISAWQAQLNEIGGAHDARRNLLLDSLEVETARALKDAKLRSDARSELLLSLAEMEALGLKTAGLRHSLESLTPAELSERSKGVKIEIEAVHALNASRRRREAVLKELSALGYEVQEGMVGAWEDSGRLVLRNASRPDYGVELTSVSGADRMQMRAVAFEAAGGACDPSRDLDAETIWCGDVSTLQSKLAAAGGGLVIEKALPVGATPLKRISAKSAQDEPADVSIPKTRSIPS